MASLNCRNSNLPYRIQSLYPSLLSYVRGRIYSINDAEDIVQDCLVILLQKSHLYKEGGNLKGWAFNIARFQILKHLTKIKRSKEDSVDYCDDFTCIKHDPYLNLVDKEIKEQRQSFLKKAKESVLSNREREFLNYFDSGLPQDQIIKLMNLKNISQYFVWKRRVVQRLKHHAKT